MDYIANICNILSFLATLILLFIEFRRNAIRIRLSERGILSNNNEYFGFSSLKNYEIGVLNKGDIPIYIDDYGFIIKKDELVSCNEYSKEYTIFPKTKQPIPINRDYLIRKIKYFSNDKNKTIRFYVKVNGKTKLLKSDNTTADVVDINS